MFNLIEICKNGSGKIYKRDYAYTNGKPVSFDSESRAAFKGGCLVREKHNGIVGFEVKRVS